MLRAALLLALLALACDREAPAEPAPNEGSEAPAPVGEARWDGWIRNDPAARPVDALPRGATALLGSGWLVDPSGHLRDIQNLPDGTLITHGSDLVGWDPTNHRRVMVGPDSRVSGFDAAPTLGLMAIYASSERADLWDPIADRSVFRLPRVEDLRQAFVASNTALIAHTDARVVDRYQLDRREPVWTYQAPSVITAWAATRDRRRLAVAASRQVYLLDAETGARRQQLDNGQQHVFALAFSPDGRRLAVSGGDDDVSVRIWSLESSSTVALIGHVGRVTDLVWIDDERLLSTGWDQTVRLWAPDAEMPAVWASRPWSRNGIQTFWVENDSEVPHPLEEVAHLAVDGERVWVSGWSAAARAVRLADGTVEPRTGHDAWVSHLAFSPDGQLLASADWNGNVLVWDWRASELHHRLLGAGSRVESLEFDGDAILARTWLAEWVYGSADGETRRVTPRGALNGAQSLAFADEDTLLVGHFSEISALDPRTAVPSAITSTSRTQWVGLGLDAQGGGWALGTFSNRPVTVFDLVNGVGTEIPAGDPYRLSFAPAGRRLAYSGGGPEEPVIAVLGFDGSVVRQYAAWAEALALAPAGDRLAIQTVDQLILLPLPDGEPTVLPFEGPGRSMTWSSDGAWLQLATESGAFLWDGRSASRERVTSEPAQALALGPNAQIATLGLDGRLTVSTAASDAQELGRVGTAIYPRHPAELAWSPSGALLAVLDEAGHVSVWDVTSGQRLWSAEGELPRADSPSFRLFDVASADSELHVVETQEGGFELRRGDTSLFTWIAGSDTHRRAAIAAFSPTGDAYAVAFADTTIAVYPLEVAEGSR